MMLMQQGEPTTVVLGMVAEATAAEAPPPPRPPPEAAEESDGGGEIIIGMDNNNKAAAAATTSSGEGDNKINSGGNRWPRQETLALLKIRSDMDSVFQDSSLKGPLWEEVSRKLGELGYQRSAKKCKEKFENVYKYHKRTKDSRNDKPEGKAKTYRFFDELEAFESRFTPSHHSQVQSQSQSQSHHPAKSSSKPSNLPPNTLTSLPFLSTRPGDHSSTTFSYVTGVTTTSTISTTVPSLNNHPGVVNMANLSTSTSSSTDSDEDLEERYRKKRKWKGYFRRLTRRVLARQEEMQRRFLDAIDKRERERVAQQEAWRMQEMARINREHEILVQERSTAASKDAAIIAFLQKLSGGSQQPPPPTPTTPPVSVVSQFQPQPPPQQQQQNQQQPQLVVMMPSNDVSYEKFEFQKMNINNHNINGSSGGAGCSGSSRWPTAEVHALIRLRTSQEAKYQENGPKAPLWEEISSELQKLGYNRNAKRCKEKWENINKYFKKIKESNKRRREDSKTCPYYKELDALYKEKTKNRKNNLFGTGNSFSHNMEPLMVQPEQQWRPPTQEEEAASRQDQYQECDEDDDDDYEEDVCGVEEDGGSIGLDDEEEGGGRGGGNGGDGGYDNNNSKNKLSSVDTVQ